MSEKRLQALWATNRKPTPFKSVFISFVVITLATIATVLIQVQLP